MIQEASNGDVAAMNCVGGSIFKGENGFFQDKEEGLQWLRKAFQSGCPIAAYTLGYCLENGYDDSSSGNAAYHCCHFSAFGGGDSGCLALGDWLAHESFDFLKVQAVHFLKKGLDGSCQHKIAGESEKTRARELLNNLQS